MRLFTIDENYTVELNKEWISLVPEFNALLKRDKGGPGDYRGEKKLKARREFSFIYFMLDFTSPLYEWPEDERRRESMVFSGLKESDLDGSVMDAYRRYDKMLQESARSLRTLRSVEKSLDALDGYFDNLNFTDKDKKGELVNSPNSYLINIQRLDAAYSAIEKFRKRVYAELKGDEKIRGTATLGRKEAQGMGDWTEGGKTPTAKSTSFKDIASLMEEAETEEEDDE